jgi:hypothetical protein
VLWPDICDNLCQILVEIGQLFVKMYKFMVIVTNIWQKLSSVEHKKMLIVKNYWQLFSQIIGETLLIVRNIWRNRTSLREQVNS